MFALILLSRVRTVYDGLEVADGFEGGWDGFRQFRTIMSGRVMTGSDRLRYDRSKGHWDGR